MDKNNSRYDLIIGFISLIVAFSAFKDELKAIHINIGFWKSNLSVFLLYVVYGFGICIYIYIIERIARQFKIVNTWKIIDYVEKTAFLIFVFIVLSPIILGIVYLGYTISERITEFEEEQNSKIASIITSILGIITGLISNLITNRYFKQRKINRQEEIENEEIKELENALKLYENNFFSQSILESFKVLEIHLVKLLSAKDLYIQRNQFSFNEILKYAAKFEIMDKKDINSLLEIRQMRNAAAHLDSKHTKEQATKTIEFTKYLIGKTSYNNEVN